MMRFNHGIIFRVIFLFAPVYASSLNQKTYAQQRDHRQYVKPFIGTTKSDVLTKWGADGGTYPGAAAPSGAIQLSPETRVNGNKGYDYSDSSIYYFSCFGHMSGFPGGSSGRFFMMPVNNQATFKVGEYHRYFKHSDETAVPGYYKVIFNDDRTIAEATASARVGMFRFTFPANAKPVLFIGDSGEVVEISNTIIHASNSNTVINFSEGYSSKKQIKGGWLFTFPSSATNKKIVDVKLSTSSVNYEGAQNNIDKEAGNLAFSQFARQTSNEWKKKLSVVDIKDSNAQNKTIFYTALYHSLLIPWVIDDVDGRYTGADGHIHQKAGKNQYGGFSPWDTFRSLNPLLTLLYPDEQKDVILSMLDIYKQTGHLPTESMTGNHAIPIIVDSYLKGITGFDKQLAFSAIKSNVVTPPFVQPDMEIYQKNGYVPFTYPESVTRTVEYAYDDWALSQFAAKAIHDTAAYRLLLNRSYNYRNLFNVDELLMLPRNKDEFKLQPGNSGYKEGDKWVYSYFVPQNTKDLINLMGGNDQFASSLDAALDSNAILFDNETVFHLPYLFNQAGRPALTQKWCRHIMLNRYSASPGGLPGNDDLGSTSSWYVFSAMGIFPVCPGTPLYAIGSPLFASVTLHLANGKDFVINSVNAAPKNKFVQWLTVNGNKWQQLTLPHSLLLKGGSITFNMGSKESAFGFDKYPVELSETKTNPDFKILNYTITKKSVEPNQPFAVFFSFSNKGVSGTKIVKLLVNGKPFATKNCLTPQGKTIEDSIICRLYPIGKTTLQIEGLEPVNVEVKLSASPQRSLFKITELTAKPMIKLNEQQEIAYSVKNIDGLTHIFKIPVLINDSLNFTDSVTLAPGAEKRISHSFVAKNKGFKRIQIIDISTDYKVYQNNVESILVDLPAISHTADKTIKDQSGFNHDGHIKLTGPAYTGDASKKLLLGDSCFVEINNSPALDKLGETITMMAWVCPTAASKGLVDLFTKGDNHVLQVSDNKTLTFFAGGWGKGDCTVNLPEDWQWHWHHIAGVCNGQILLLYIDGILKGSVKLETKANLSVLNKWTLGRNEEFPSERIFHGYIDKVKVFEAPLSGEEVIGIFRNEQKYF